jgi:hypothetical protein
MFFFAAAGTTSVFAQDSAPATGVKPYGNLYLFMGYGQTETYDAADQKVTSRETMYNVLNDSNIGFSFTYSQYSGIFELGLNGQDSERKVSVLKAYGTYKTGAGEFMAGQAYNPYVRWSHEEANLSRSKNFGALFSEPEAQLMLKSPFGLYVDIIKPYVPTTTYYKNNDSTLTTSGEGEYTVENIDREITTGLSRSNIDALFPKVAVGFDIATQIVDFGVGCAGNFYRIKNTDGIKFNTEWVKSFVAYTSLNVKYSDFRFLLNGGAAINPANLGISVASAGSATYHPGAACAIENIATGKYEIKDTWNAQAFAEIGWFVSKTIEFNIGAGGSVVDYPVANTDRDFAYECYANINFVMGGFITVAPSVSYRDYMKDMKGVKEGKELIAGLLTTVSFY